MRDGSGKRERASTWFARLLREQVELLGEFVGDEHQLVPIPSSDVTPEPVSRANWPMYDLAKQMEVEGLVAQASPSLLRRTVVPKAHSVPTVDKPSVLDHLDSLAIDFDALSMDAPLTLLDDVVSSGTTAMACLLALRNQGFEGEVRLLTATHTVSGDYDGSPTASAHSEVVWFDDRGWRRAWRPPNDVEFV